MIAGSIDKQYLGNVPEFIISFVEKVYNSEDRHFHNCAHINSILKLIKNENLDDATTKVLTYAALFHDIVYEPWNKRINKDGNTITDEELSAAYFIAAWEDDSEFGSDLRSQLLPSEADDVKYLILQTNGHSGTDPISIMFNIFDTKILSSKDISELIEYEHQIFKEYSFMQIDLYKYKRCRFLEKYSSKNPLLKQLSSYVANREYRIAFYPGSFNPFHIGHLDVIRKAEQIFDKVVVVQSQNPKKEFMNINTVYELQKRETFGLNKNKNIISQIFEYDLSSISVYAKYNPVLIRGARNSLDFLHEESYLKFCKAIHPKLRSSIIIGDSQYSHISSFYLRELQNMEDSKSVALYKSYIVK